MILIVFFDSSERLSNVFVSFFDNEKGDFISKILFSVSITVN